MGLFERLFIREKQQQISEKAVVSKAEKTAAEWQELSGYLPAENSEYQLVSLVATAIAAGNKPESQFTIKRISKRNPEAQLVGVIASSIASAEQPRSQFVIRSIKEKRSV